MRVVSLLLNCCNTSSTSSETSQIESDRGQRVPDTLMHCSIDFGAFKPSSPVKVFSHTFHLSLNNHSHVHF